MAEHESGDDDAAMRARLSRLSTSLDARETEADRATKGAGGDTSLGGAMSLGIRVLTEFVAGVAIGTLIGWQLDVWLNTSPIFLIVFLTLGTVAGFWNVYRIAAKPTGQGPL